MNALSGGRAGAMNEVGAELKDEEEVLLVDDMVQKSRV